MSGERRAAVALLAAALALGPAAAREAAAQAVAEPGPPPAADAGPAPRGPLGDTVRPLAYRLDLTVDPTRPRFTGKVEIDVTIAAPGQRAFYLHGRGLAMRAVTLTTGGATQSGAWTQVDPTGVARLDFARPLPAGTATLSFAYDAPFGDNASGLHHVKVGGDWYVWSQFESIDARAAFPGFDQPSFKVPFTVTLRTPPGLVAVSNAPETQVTRAAGLDVHRFAPTRPLPTYLVALMVGPFAVAAGEAPPTPERAAPLPLRIVATRPNAGKLAFALAQTPSIVSLLEGYFGDAFPYPKLDQIASPVEGGAMENAGADLYDDGIIVLDENAPTADKREFGMVVAHELSHQWFGDLVTPAWWDDIWLNESFANWMGYRIGDAWRPELNIRAGALAEGFAAMDTDALLAGRPIRQQIATNDQIDTAFDSITYGKGGRIVAMIAAFMGDAKFRDGVRRYIAAHRYANATSAAFFAALAEAASDPAIVPAMRSFTDQQGVPLLTFSAAGGGDGRYHVAQSRYAAFGAEAPAQRWGVPMCVRRGDARDCRLLADAAADLTVAGAGPLVPNAGGTGYYRFELPPAGWDALIAAADRLDGGEAQALVDSLDASIRAGRSGIPALARLTERLATSADSYAADAAVSAMEDYVDEGLVDDDGRAGWRRFQGRLFAPLLATYGFDPRRGAYAADDPQRAVNRIDAVYRVQASDRADRVDGALAAAARAYLAGDAAALDPAFYHRAFAAYVKQGKLTAARTLVARALASEDPQFRPAALQAAATSGRADAAAWLLGYADPRLRESEKRFDVAMIMATSATREQGYAWLRDHYAAWSSGVAGIFVANALPAMLNRFCSVARADDIARDFAAKLKGTPGELGLARAIERVRNCGRLKDAKGARIAADFAALR